MKMLSCRGHTEVHDEHRQSTFVAIVFSVEAVELGKTRNMRVVLFMVNSKSVELHTDFAIS